MTDERAALLEQQQADLHGKHWPQPEQPQNASLQPSWCSPWACWGWPDPPPLGQSQGGLPGWGPGLKPGEQLLRLQDEMTGMTLQLESGLALRLLDEGGA